MNGRTSWSPRGRARGRWPTAVLLVVASCALLTAPLSGQDRRERRGPPVNRQELEQRLRTQMTRIIQERLELTDEESERLSQVMEHFQEERRTLARSEQATRRRVEEVTAEEGDDAEARELLDRLVELRAEESRLFQAEQEALLDVLTPTQVLRLHALREQMGRRIRALRGRRPGGDAARRPPGAHAPIVMEPRG